MYIDITMAIIIVAIIAFIVAKVIKIARLPKAERIELIKSYVVGYILKAEIDIGAGKGKDKLEAVKAQFAKKAPALYKFALELLKDVSLDDIIEEGLKEIKGAFNGGK